MPTLLTSTAITAIQLKEGASPGTPASGYLRVYAYTDSTFHLVNDAGTDISITGLYTGGIAIASQAAGDLITGASSTALGRLAKGTAYQVLHMNSGATAPEWTSTLGATGTRLTAGFFTDLTVTNAITGSVTGTAATVTGATQASITTCANLVTVGTITSGIWNAGAVTSSGNITAGSGGLGVFTGDYVYRNAANSLFTIYGGTSGESGAWVKVYGTTHATKPNQISFGNAAETINFSATGAATFAAGVSATTGTFSGNLKVTGTSGSAALWLYSNYSGSEPGMEILNIAGATTFAHNANTKGTILGGALQIGSLGAFAASDKYLVVDASGNVHVSALGPAS